jgi:hypothetical protein
MTEPLFEGRGFSLFRVLSVMEDFMAKGVWRNMD